MLKRSLHDIKALDASYPDISDTILNIENRKLPDCPNCESEDTATVQVGVIGRTITIAASTTKIKLVPNGIKKQTHYCNTCATFFTPIK